MSESGEDVFVFKEKEESRILPKHPRAFMSKLEALLADLKISIDSDTVEITGEILKSTDEDIAKALFGLFEQTQSITEIEDTDTAREFVLNHTNMQRLILRARQLVAED